MRKRTGILEFMKNYRERHRCSSDNGVQQICETIKTVFEKMLIYYDFTDLEETKNYRDIFELIYVDCNQASYERLADRFYMDFFMVKRFVYKSNLIIRS